MKIFFVLVLFLLNTESLYSVSCDYCVGDHDCMEARAAVALHRAQKGHGGGASGKWIDRVTPKRGWSCYQMEDLGAGNEMLCEMCERENPRYIHHMIHGNSPDTKPIINLAVGCICAGYMDGSLDDLTEVAGSYEWAHRRTKDVTNRGKRRQNFPTLAKWKTSDKGNAYIKSYYDNHIVITQGRGRFSALINGNKIGQWFDSEEDAKLAAFDYIFPARYTP